MKKYLPGHNKYSYFPIPIPPNFEFFPPFILLTSPTSSPSFPLTSTTLSSFPYFSSHLPYFSFLPLPNLPSLPLLPQHLLLASPHYPNPIYLTSLVTFLHTSHPSFLLLREFPITCANSPHWLPLLSHLLLHLLSTSSLFLFLLLSVLSSPHFL